MAKRTRRSDADDGGTPAPQAPKRTRSRAAGADPAAGRQAVTADDPTVASAPTLDTTEAARPTPTDQRPPDNTITSTPRQTGTFKQGGGPTDEEIRRRAYELYVERGGRHGLHDDDWHRAERELRRERK